MVIFITCIMRFIMDNFLLKKNTMNLKTKFFVITLFFVSLICKSQNIIPSDSSLDIKVDELISKMTLEEKMAQLLYNSPGVPRLGIPEYNWWNEGLHGVARFGRATVFPQPIGMAATFDPELIKQVASAIGDEARAKHNAANRLGNTTQYSGLTLWSPNVNIFRDPRWGRGMETWGEDPMLTSQMGVAFVKGLQGEDPYYLKTAACAKHFAVHSGPESERHSFDANPPVKDLYETYLPSFEALVKADVASVMCAYNRIYGEPACASDLLINDILRGRWGFKGYLLSDCWAIVDFHQGHKVTRSVEESAALALKHGIDLNCGEAYKALPIALEKGLIKESDIDNALRSLYRILFRLGILDSQKQNPYANISEEVVGSEKHKSLAREVAQKSIVLLKDNNVLPLNKDMKHLYVIGPHASDVDILLGNYNGQSADCRTILEGITSKVDLGTRLEYRKGFMYDQPNRNDINWAMDEAKEAEAVIAVVGLSTLTEGEEGEAIASDFKSDRRDLNLPATQIKYLQELRSKVKGKLIVLVTGGSPVNLQEIYQMADALLFVWYPGEQGGDAVADILFGDALPSGKLPITFPMDESQLPDYNDYSMDNRTYKYSTGTPMFPFGFGLTAAKVELSNLEVKEKQIKPNKDLKFSFKVNNPSKKKVSEVIQVYLRTEDKNIATPLFDLKEFMRIELEAGQAKEYSMQIPYEKFANYNDKGEQVWLNTSRKLYISTSLPTSRSLELGSPMYLESSFSVK